jgi:intein/homing endonuclease
LLLRLGISSRAYRIPQGKYRDIWHLQVAGVYHQTRFLQIVDAHGAKFFDARAVFAKLDGVKSNVNVDTIPREVWEIVRQGLTDQGMPHRAFAAAMQTKFCGSTMWKHSPSRGRLHRAATILDDQVLHDLTNNDVFWDKVVEVTSIGEQDIYAVTLTDADNLVAQSVSILVG